ncbi:MAG: hypothetical protein VB997_03825 [Opitutales bacterium]
MRKLPVALGVALLMAGCAEESAEDRIRKAKVIGSTELVLSSGGAPISRRWRG